MKLEEIFITEDSIIKDAIEHLEKVRCKVVYVVNEKRLVASISDGDIRRYVLKDGDIKKNIQEIANYKPVSFYRYQTEEIQRHFENTEIFSVPLLNYNKEIVAVEFRNGRRIFGKKQLQTPVVIMAGGKGSRLYPYTKILPKALIPIGEVPITEIIMNRFMESGSKRFYLIVNHKKSMMHSYFENIDKECSIQLIDEKLPLGTGGGLTLLREEMKETFFLTNCDIIIDADYSEILEMHIKNKNVITIVAAKYEKKLPYGVIKKDEKDNYLGLSEKPIFQYLINTGMYVVDEIVIREMQKEEEISFPEIIEIQKKKGRKIGVYTVEESAYMDMGQIEEMEKMKDKLRMR